MFQRSYSTLAPVLSNSQLSVENKHVMQANKRFCIEATDPQIDLSPVSLDVPYTPIVCSSLVRNMHLSFEAFMNELEAEIMRFPKDTLLAVFPEYCWRLTLPEDVFDYIHNRLKKIIPKHLTLVLGTLEFTLNGAYTANAIILRDEKLWFRPKTKLLEGEVRQGLAFGCNAGVIKLPGFNLGVLVCADLWENQLVHQLVVEQGADILAVPAWTAAINRKVARKDWYALTRTQSTNYSVIVAVSDHLHGTTPNLDVANATQIRSPDKRMQEEPEGNVEKFIAFIDCKQVQQSINHWHKKGLAPALLFNQNNNKKNIKPDCQSNEKNLLSC